MVHGRPYAMEWVAENVPQCGYCQSGQIMAAAALLEALDGPLDQQVLEFLAVAAHGVPSRVACSVIHARISASPRRMPDFTVPNGVPVDRAMSR